MPLRRTPSREGNIIDMVHQVYEKNGFCRSPILFLEVHDYNDTLRYPQIFSNNGSPYITYIFIFMLSSYLRTQARGEMVGTGPQVGTVLPGPSCGESGVSGLGLRV